MTIPVAGSWITDKEVAYVADAARNGWYENAYKYTTQFETEFANYVSRKYALSLPSATSGLHLALLALGIGKGDEVIVPDITWIATAAPITYVGATPVFADCDRDTWCMNPTSFANCITDKTKAVIPVDLYGNMPAMKLIEFIADLNEVVVIEDAAEAIGSKYYRNPAGSFGAASVFSFHGTKTLTTGEGGMLVTDDKNIYDRCKYLSGHANLQGDKMFWNGEVGYKYRMSSVQAALGIAQLERIGELVKRKRDIFLHYKRQLKSNHLIQLNCERPDTYNSYWMTTAIICGGVPKEWLMAKMKEAGIDTRPFFYPLSSQPAYAHMDYGKERTPVSYLISPHGINLPSPMNITEEQIDYVCYWLQESINDYFRD